MDVRLMSDDELHNDLIDCIQLEGEAKRRAEPIRKELLRRQVETGEATVERSGWNYTLKREAVTATWVERHYGYPKKEIPAKCYVEEVEFNLSPELVLGWLTEQGHATEPTYSLSVARKKN